MAAWDESVEVERQLTEKGGVALTRTQTPQLLQLRNEAYRKTRNSLFVYVFALYKEELANPLVQTVPLTPERVAETTQVLRNHLTELNGNTKFLDTLIEELGALQNKNQEFIFKVFVTLNGELLKKQLKDNITIANLNSELEKSKSSVDKRFQASIAAENTLLQTEQEKVQLNPTIKIR